MNSYSLVDARFHNAVLLVVGLAMCLASNSGQAQTSSSVSNEGLQEVLVTAEKRTESLQSVPMSVSVLTASQLSELKLDTPSDLTTYFPNLQVNDVNGAASPLFSLRGVSMFDFSLNQSSPIGSYVDEVYKGNVVLFGVEMYDLERIEVLRGPQGTLYGKNTTGGAINFITAKPGFDTEAEITLGVGNYNRKEAEGTFQAALVPDRLAVRVAFTYTKADGFIENIYPGAPDLQGIDQYGLRLSLLYRASDNLDFTLRYSKSEQDPQNYGIIAGNIATAPPYGPGIGGTGYFRTLNGMENGTPLTLYQIDQGYTPRRSQDNQAVALTANWRIAQTLSLTSITSWDDGSLYVPDITDGAPVSVVRDLVTGDTRQFTQDLRVTSSTGGPFDFIVGAYYQHQVMHDTNEAPFFNFLDVTGDGVFNYQDCAAASFAPPGFGVGYASGAVINPACRYYNSFDQIMRSWSVYADGSYQIAPRVKLRAGVRYNDDRGTQDNALNQLRGTDEVPIANLGFFSLQPGGYYAPTLVLPGSPNYDTLTNETRRQDLHNTAWTGHAGIDVTPTNDTLLYLSYSRGYRSAAFNAQFLFAPSDFNTVEPETLDSIELGFKTAWLENRLQLNGAVFHYQYRNQQIINTQPDGEEPLVNLPKSKIDGGELELVTRPSRSLTVRAGLGVLDAKVQEGVIEGVDIAGHTLPTAPTFSGTLSADWDAWTLGPAILTLHVDGSYASKQYFEVINLDRIAQGGYGLLNARVAIHGLDNKWTVAVWGSNLTDKAYFTNEANLEALGFDYRHIGAPLMYGLTASYRF
jgi:iron complex outermembrane receptor protein